MITVVQLEQTCPAFPSQWEGRTASGDHVYVRYRHGTLRIGVGATEHDAIANAMASEDSPVPTFVLVAGDALDGEMSYETLKALTAGVVEWPA